MAARPSALATGYPTHASGVGALGMFWVARSRGLDISQSRSAILHPLNPRLRDREPQRLRNPAPQQLRNPATARPRNPETAQPRALLLRDPSRVVRGAVEKAFDRPSQRQLLVQFGGLFEIEAQALGLGQVVVAQADLDPELRVLLRQGAHPLFDLPAAVFVAGAAPQVFQQRRHDARQDLRPLVVQWFLCLGQCFLCHGRGC